MAPNADELLEQAAWVRRLAAQLTRSAEDAEDLTQETLAVALRRGPREGVPLGRWLAAVARNLASSDRRARSRRVERETRVAHEAIAHDTHGAGDPAQVLERLEAHARLVEAVRALPEPYRSAVTRRYLDGLSPAEIASAEGLPPRTVHTRLNRGLDQLRRSLGSRGLAAWAGILRGGEAVGVPPSANGGPQAGPLGGPTAGASQPALPAGGAGSLMIGGLLLKTKTQLILGAAAALGLLWAVRPDAGPPQPPAGAEPASPAHLEAPPQAAEDRPDEPAALPLAPQGPRRAKVASTPADPPVETGPAPEPARVLGRLIDLSGRGVGGVAVSAGPAIGAPTALSGPDGRFELELDGDAGRPVVSDPGWVALFESPGAGSPVPAGRSPDERLLVVAPRIELAGQVVDGDALPVEGARVTWTLPATARNQTGVDTSGLRVVALEAHTDERGGFELVGAAAPGAFLFTSAAGLPADSRQAPEATDRGLLIELSGGAADQLSGVVLDASGAPAEGARVALGFAHGRSGPDGRFSLRIPARAGDLDGPQNLPRLSAALPGQLPAFLDCVGDDPRAPGAWPDPLVLRLGGPPLTLAGRVVERSGDPVAGVEVRLLDRTRFGTVSIPGRVDMSMLAMVEDLLAGSDGVGPRDAPRTDDDGRFELDGLMAKDYRLLVVDAERGRMREFGPFPAGTAGHRLQLPEHAVHPRVAGRAVSLSGQPIAGAWVQAQLAGPDARPGEELGFVDAVVGPGARTDEEGRFEFLELSTAVTHFSISGKQVAFHRGQPIPAGADLEALELTAPLSCRFRVDVGQAWPEAIRVELLDADGRILDLVQSEAEFAFSSASAMLSGGRSAVLSAPETATLARIQLADGGARDIPVRLVPDELTTISP